MTLDRTSESVHYQLGLSPCYLILPRQVARGLVPDDSPPSLLLRQAQYERLLRRVPRWCIARLRQRHACLRRPFVLGIEHAHDQFLPMTYHPQVSSSRDVIRVFVGTLHR